MSRFFSGDRLRQIRAYLLLLAIALFAVLVRESPLALIGVFLLLIEFYIRMRRSFKNQIHLSEVCSFYDSAHSLGDLQILRQDERPFKKLLKAVTELGGFDWSVLFLMNFEKNVFEAAESDGVDLAKFAPLGFDELKGASDSDEITLSAKLLEYAFKKYDFRGALAGSILEKNGAYYGCLLVGRFDENAELDDEDSLRLNILSDQISISLHNHYMHKEIAQRAQALALQQEKTKKELYMARLVQENAMSRQNPTLNGLSLASYWRPAGFIGGDFLRFVKNKNADEIGVFIGDVCGKGAPAALIMTVVVSLFKEKTSLYSKPNELLNEINASLKEFLGSGLTLNSSALWGIFNTDKMTFKYANAGHDFPLHIKKSDCSINELASTGTLLGIFKKSEYGVVEIAIQEGDKIIFYSDGLLDFFEFNLGHKNSYEAFKEFCHARAFKSANEIVSEISSLVENSAIPTKDDITLAVFAVEKRS